MSMQITVKNSGFVFKYIPDEIDVIIHELNGYFIRNFFKLPLQT